MLRSRGSVAWVMTMPQGVTSDEDGSVLSTWQVALAETGVLPLGGGAFLADVVADLEDSGPKSPTSDGRLYTAVLRLYSGSTFFTPDVPLSKLAARVTCAETCSSRKERKGGERAAVPVARAAGRDGSYGRSGRA